MTDEQHAHLPAPEVLITWPDYPVEAGDRGGAFRAAGVEIRLAAKLGDRAPAEVLRLVGGAAGAIVSTDPFTGAVFDRAPDLRVIARVGVGTDSVDLAAATAHGVVVTVTPGANEPTVAEHTVALMLALARRVREHDAAVRRGEWKRTGPHLPGSLHGSTVGLVGFGSIGRMVADLLRVFSVRVVATDPDPGFLASNVERVPLQTLLASSDIVSLHAPLHRSTAGLIGEAELQQMRPGALLVNTARGGMVDERALLAALRSGHLRGAALDVFEREPPQRSGLLELPNVIATPHVAGLSERSVAEMTRRATTSVLDVLAGRRPRDVANPDVFAHRRFARAGATAGEDRA